MMADWMVALMADETAYQKVVKMADQTGGQSVDLMGLPMAAMTVESMVGLLGD
jgi:hypothetical protein